MQIKAMRDTFLTSLYEKMKSNKTIFFVAADFGAPILDKIREDYPDRFINVGIAEQNLVNVATGLALEGFTVYAYAIAPFITMRCYEQIRVNVSILSHVRPMNINFIGVGAGVSYAMSGPSHHCLEDLSIMNTLPNIEVFSPSDYMTAEAYVDRTIAIKTPKYIRLDAQPMVALENNIQNFDDGFRILKKGKKLAIISTGYMSQKSKEIAENFDITLIDLYFINNYDKSKLENALKDIDNIITIEEAFKSCGGLDAQINYNFKNKTVVNLGFEKKYTFEIGSREFVHGENSIGKDDIISEIRKQIEKIFIINCHDHIVHYGLISPFPGSPIWNHCINEKVITDKKVYYENIHSGNGTHNLMNMTKIPGDDFFKYIDYTNYKTIKNLTFDNKEELDIQGECPHCHAKIEYLYPQIHLGNNIYSILNSITPKINWCSECHKRIVIPIIHLFENVCKEIQFFIKEIEIRFNNYEKVILILGYSVNHVTSYISTLNILQYYGFDYKKLNIQYIGAIEYKDTYYKKILGLDVKVINFNDSEVNYIIMPHCDQDNTLLYLKEKNIEIDKIIALSNIILKN